MQLQYSAGPVHAGSAFFFLLGSVIRPLALASIKLVMRTSGGKSRCMPIGCQLAYAFSNKSGGRLQKFIQGKAISPYLGPDLKEKLTKPLIFQGPTVVAGNALPPTKVHGFDVTMLIDVCRAIVTAAAEGKLLPRRLYTVGHRPTSPATVTRYLGTASLTSRFLSRKRSDEPLTFP